MSMVGENEDYKCRENAFENMPGDTGLSSIYKSLIIRSALPGRL